MLSELQLGLILKKNESSILDFKQEMYEFNNEQNLKETAKFVKDVISFSNTIRTETGYIIIGVKENKEVSHEVIGLKYSIDDSILQEKIKDKVFPRPSFLFYEINYRNKRIGILEFPIVKYELPITASVKMKGLETGKVYYRNGTSNTEANAIDTIRINDWFKSLPGSNSNSLSEKISGIIKRLTQNHEKLSVILTDIWQIAKEHKINELENFVYSQIKGINHSDAKNHLYRRQKLIISPLEVEINHFSFYDLTPAMVKREMLQMEGFFEYKMLFIWPIVTLEEWIQNYGDTKFGTLKMSAQQIFGEGDYKVNVFIFGDDLRSVYSNIKQKLIDELIDT